MLTKIRAIPLFKSWVKKYVPDEEFKKYPLYEEVKAKIEALAPKEGCLTREMMFKIRANIMDNLFEEAEEKALSSFEIELKSRFPD